MRLLVTRPEPDGARIRACLEALGHEVSLAPLFDIVLEPVATADVAQAGSLIATSRNGLRALVASEALAIANGKRLFVTGPGSRALAEANGFTDVVAGPAGAAALSAIIIGATADRPGERLLYVSGDRIAFDLEGALARAGRTVVRRVVYRQVPRAVLDNVADNALRAGGIDGVLLYSPASAARYAELLAKTGIGAAELRNTVHFCLSPAVAEALDRLAVPIAIAARPNAEEMLALLLQVAAVSARET